MIVAPSRILSSMAFFQQARQWHEPEMIKARTRAQEDFEVEIQVAVSSRISRRGATPCHVDKNINIVTRLCRPFSDGWCNNRSYRCYFFMLKGNGNNKECDMEKTATAT